MKGYEIITVKKYADKKKLISELTEEMRDIDRREIEGMGFSSAQAAEYSIMATSPVYVARSNAGKLIACWGLEILDFKRNDGTHSYSYVIWALGTEQLKHFEKSFVKESSAIIKHWVDLYGCLQNTVATFNTRSIKWLKWLGAEFSAPYKIGNTEYVNFRIEKRKESEENV
jgi:hypothetical protein